MAIGEWFTSRIRGWPCCTCEHDPTNVDALSGICTIETHEIVPDVENRKGYKTNTPADAVYGTYESRAVTEEERSCSKTDQPQFAGHCGSTAALHHNIQMLQESLGHINVCPGERIGYRGMTEDVTCQHAKGDVPREPWKVFRLDLPASRATDDEANIEDAHIDVETHELPGGRSYVGQWLDERMHGEGTLRTPSGGGYSGQFLYGKKHGVGEYTWPNGAKYAGQWKDNKGNGFGVLYQPDGDTRHGEWRNGKVVRWITDSTPLRQIVFSPRGEEHREV